MRIKVLSGGRKNIELSLSDAELNFQMRRIGIEETVPMCRLVEVSEKDNPLHRFEGQTVNMDEVNFFAKRMESLTEYERKVLSAYAEDYGVATMKDLINLTFSMKGLSLLTDFSDARQVGVRLYMDEFLGMSEEEKEQTKDKKSVESIRNAHHVKIENDFTDETSPKRKIIHLEGEVQIEVLPSFEDKEAVEEKTIKRRTNVWMVSGHLRHYKSGKVIFISSYPKGPERDKKKPKKKDYDLPQEDDE